MKNSKKVAVVTGANRGIGLEICRQLAKEGDIKVILTSRNQSKGKKACEALKKEGLDVLYHRLDVTDTDSIDEFVDYLEGDLGRCDILVNNAGVFPDTQNANPDIYPSFFEGSLETIKEAMETNVYGPVMLCQAIVPLMKEKKYGRIVNMSSGMGQLKEMNGGCPAYRISKTALNAVTKILSDELKDTNIKINSMCPGWVKTDMGGPHATRELPEGADTAVWLATLPDDGPSGGFYRDRKSISW